MVISSYNNYLSKLQEEAKAITTTRGHILNLMSSITRIALIIIACIGIRKAWPGSTMGWVAIGLGSEEFALSLAVGKLKERKITLSTGAIFTLCFVSLGILGVRGTLSGMQVGKGIIWVFLAPLITGFCFGCCLGTKMFMDQKSFN